MVKVKIKKQEKNEINLEIEVDQAEVASQLEKVYNDLSYRVKIPGFRQGKIPKNILNLHLGKEYFYQKAAESIIPQSYLDAVKEVNIEPIEQPRINITQIEEDKPLIYEVTVQVKPEVKIGSLKDIKIKREDQKITEEDIENEIKRIQESHAVLKVVNDRLAREGDFLVIDAEAYLDGKPIEYGKWEKQLIQLGKSAIKEFNEKLVGCQPGEEREIKIVLPPKDEPGGEPDKEAKEKEVLYKIKILEIKEKELPELNDDFAKTIGEFSDLKDLKDKIGQELNRQMERINQSNFEQKLLEKVADICEVEIPNVLVEREINYLLKSLEEDLKSQKMSLPDYYKSINSNEEEVRKEYEVVAEKRIKEELILDKIAQEIGLEVSEEEIKDKVKTIAEKMEQDPLKVEANLKKNNNWEGLRENIRREKTIEYITKQVTIIDSEEEEKSK